MSIELSDKIVVVLLYAVMPAAVLFPLIYGFTSPWWRSLAGCALLVKSVSTFMLLGLAVLVRIVEIDESLAALFRVVIIAAICVGVNMMFLALVIEKWQSRSEKLRFP